MLEQCMELGHVLGHWPNMRLPAEERFSPLLPSTTRACWGSEASYERRDHEARLPRYGTTLMMDAAAHIGLVDRTLAGSVPTFHKPTVPRRGAPNIVIIVLDDMGFADLGCYGSVIRTPRIDRLAQEGLRYNQFHVTALCSPTRAALLTGRNHHAVGMGGLAFMPVAFPGYNGRIPKSAAVLARHLRDSGYSTFAVGKWHLAPDYETTPSGPFERWPLGMGFEHFYGFLGGLTNQWAPDLVRGNEFIDPPKSPEGGYHLTEDLSEQAIRFLQTHQESAPQRPFFLYFATGAMHFPHQVPDEWTTPYSGQFDEGWDSLRQKVFERQKTLRVVPQSSVLTMRPPWVRPWEELSSQEHKLFSRQMEVYAGFLSHTDAQIGRLLSYLERVALLENTLLILLSDNGASAEGGPNGWTNPAYHGRINSDVAPDRSNSERLARLGSPLTYGHYAWGWAWTGNTPFKLWKRYAWLGGVRVPLIVYWPNMISNSSRGQVRGQFCHAVDITPTVLAAAGLEPRGIIDGTPQQNFDGKSLLKTFDDPGAESPRVIQYFEVLGSRSIYYRGWKATTDHIDMGNGAERELIVGSECIDTDRWSLYNLEEDFSEANDLAEVYPEQLRKLIELWWVEAGRNQVLPVKEPQELIESVRESSRDKGPQRLVYGPFGGPISTPSLSGGFLVTADVELPNGDERGTICAQGDFHAGWACYVLNGELVLTFSFASSESRLRSGAVALKGRHTVTIQYDMVAASGAIARLCIDKVEVAGPVEGGAYYRFLLSVEKLFIGRDRGLPVSKDYQPPFAFTGIIHDVVLEVLPTSRDSIRSVSGALRND